MYAIIYRMYAVLQQLFVQNKYLMFPFYDKIKVSDIDFKIPKPPIRSQHVITNSHY